MENQGPLSGIGRCTGFISRRLKTTRKAGNVGEEGPRWQNALAERGTREGNGRDVLRTIAKGLYDHRYRRPLQGKKNGGRDRKTRRTFDDSKGGKSSEGEKTCLQKLRARRLNIKEVENLKGGVFYHEMGGQRNTTIHHLEGGGELSDEGKKNDLPSRDLLLT